MYVCIYMYIRNNYLYVSNTMALKIKQEHDRKGSVVTHRVVNSSVSLSERVVSLARSRSTTRDASQRALLNRHDVYLSGSLATISPA